MDNLREIVEEIRRRCNSSELEVSTTLAAFVARAVVLDNEGGKFNLDSGMDSGVVEELINLAIEKLCLEDSPRMDTIRMQVGYDLVFVETEEDIEQKELFLRKSISRHVAFVANSQLTGVKDMSVINAAYRQIFELLLVKPHSSHLDTRVKVVVEREIAAALESVLPRIGMKSFLQLPGKEKTRQIEELSSIVLGIRLFNKELGKGGCGIDETASDSLDLCTSLLKTLKQERIDIGNECEEYSTCLVALSKTALPDQLKRWKEELINRRQYFSYITALLTHIEQVNDSVQQHVSVFEQTIVDLNEIVGSRATVAKEQVYPKFDLAARAWEQLENYHAILLSRRSCLDVLQQYKSTYTKTLAPCIVAAAAKQPPLTEIVLENTLERKEEEPESKYDEPIVEEESKTDPGQPQRLSMEDTEHFMDLPLEFQGFCPCTLVQENGLLLPGDPTHGVVQYQDRYYVFHNEATLHEFLKNAEDIKKNVLTIARTSPDLIHLLSLQKQFPEISLNNLSRKQRNVFSENEEVRASTSTTGTETPVHFVESFIDREYEWNEWSLRRKALQLINLRNCRTVSAQTVSSHFRRHAETQVYLPKDSITQTGISTGTNPQRKVNYITGLRCSQRSSFVKGKNQHHTPQAKVVNFTFDL